MQGKRVLLIVGGGVAAYKTPELVRLDDLERQLRHLDAEIADKQTVLRSLQRREGPDGQPLAVENGTIAEAELDAAKRAVKEALDRLRAELRTTMQEHFAAGTFSAESNTPAGPQPVFVARRAESYAVSVDTLGKLRWA